MEKEIKSYTCIIDKPEWIDEKEFHKFALGESFSLYFEKAVGKLSQIYSKRKAKKIVYKGKEKILEAFPDINVYYGTTTERAAFDINADNPEEANKKLGSLVERLESFFKEQGIEQKMVLRPTNGFTPYN